MRVCSKCQVGKPFACFGVNKRMKLGFNSWCKDCENRGKILAYKANPQKYRDRKNKEYSQNKEKILSRVKAAQPASNKRRRERYATDPHYRSAILESNKNEEHRYLCRKWQRENSSRMSYHNATRRTLKAQAKPIWLTAIDEAQMQEMYDVARALTVQTGIEHHVDHIHPLKGNGFNGLHVPWNLQVIPAPENLKKRNKLPAQEQHLAWSL